jgi:histidinol dehydrogenase
MQIIKHPAKETWNNLLKRPVFDSGSIREKVHPILEDVKKNGDEAVKKYTRQFDGFIPESLMVTEKEMEGIDHAFDELLRDAIHLAVNNITKFHQAQRREVLKIETWFGVTCWRKQIPIEKVGLYIPGGTAPLFSSLLMLGIPAMIAGCKEIILCTPPDKDGKIHPAIMYSAHILGLEKIYKIGGAQAIAAMAYGTETVPKVDKIFGPGNQFVTAAKQIVTLDGVAIDMPAGPSEVAVIADDSADPEFLVWDLLSQAEHGTDSQVLLISDSEKIINSVNKAVTKHLKNLPRKSIAAGALKNSKLIITDSVEIAMDICNHYAPEHLIINTVNADEIATKVINAGSVFIGPYTPESAGDYASGTNHTLPTNGYARSYSGVSLDSFMKQVTFQKIDPHGIGEIGWAIEEMAKAESLTAHKNAVTVRLDAIRKEKLND